MIWSASFVSKINILLLFFVTAFISAFTESILLQLIFSVLLLKMNNLSFLEVLVLLKYLIASSYIIVLDLFITDNFHLNNSSLNQYWQDWVLLIDFDLII